MALNWAHEFVFFQIPFALTSSYTSVLDVTLFFWLILLNTNQKSYISTCQERSLLGNMYPPNSLHCLTLIYRRKKETLCSLTYLCILGREVVFHLIRIIVYIKIKDPSSLFCQFQRTTHNFAIFI